MMEGYSIPNAGEKLTEVKKTDRVGSLDWRRRHVSRVAAYAHRTLDALLPVEDSESSYFEYHAQQVRGSFLERREGAGIDIDSVFPCQ